MQQILKKGCSGPIHTAIGKMEFNQVPIPFIDENTQLEIKKQISNSFNLKNQSEHLLEVAKRTVEIAIEEDKEMALEYIRTQAS